MTPAVSVKEISKQYTLGSELMTGQSFREMLLGAIFSPFKKIARLKGRDESQERFWALKNISFEIQPGEIVGVIGRNGAGKSTLLKILSRITTPTEGSVRYSGRLASLLEVGTGFHPELTGRENIFLNGAILGMSRREIEQRMPAIVEFAEIEKFLDTPVKRYSSGMYVRLAFSVAAHLDADILLVDEVLAVGDSKFQKKCIAKMAEAADDGKTVVFISHNMQAVAALCTRGIWLDKGAIRLDADIDTVLNQYERQSALDETTKRDVVAGNDTLTLSDISISGMQNSDSNRVNALSSLQIRIAGECKRTISELSLQVGLYHERGERLSLLDSSANLNPARMVMGKFESTCTIAELPLTSGRYTINVALLDGESLILAIDRAAGFYVDTVPDKPQQNNVYGPLLLTHSWSIKADRKSVV